MTRPRFRLPLLGLVALAGCAHSPRSTILTLDAVAPSAAGVRADYRGPAVAVPAVHVPAALDRVEFVREPAAGTLEVDDFARWGAPLGLLARDALVRDLTSQLPEGRVLPSGVPAGKGAVTLSVTITAFAVTPGATRLEAAWRALPDGPIRQATLDAPGAATPAETAQRFANLLGQLAQRIAATLPDGPAPAR